MKKQISAPQDAIIIGTAAYLPGVQAAVTFSNKDIFSEPASPSKVPTKDGKTNRGAAPWGATNNLPAEVIDITEKNPIASRCLEFKTEISYGSGIKIGLIDETGNFRELTAEEKAGKYKDVQDFFDNNDLDAMYSELILDLHWFQNGFVELILNQDLSGSRAVVEMSAKEAAFSRLEVSNPDTGNVENHFYSSYWPSPKAEQVDTTPVIWQKNTGLELERRIGRTPYADGKVKDEKKFRYIIPVRLPSPGRVYYPKPTWYSIIDSGWMDFANKIPLFKQALMTNSINVYYHIEISPTYFPRIFKEEGIKTAKDQQARIQTEFTNLNNFLKGEKNAGKTLITYTRTVHGANGRQEEVPEIKISVIDKKIGGEYLEDSHEASAMTFIAMGVHPSMIGIIPGKTSSNLSGTDKRELLRISQSLQSRIRSRALKPLYAVKRINKWPAEIEFSIQDIILTTLDQGRETQTVTQV